MTPHPQIARTLQRRGIPADRLRADGGLALALGDRVRMQLLPLPGGRLLFEGRIAALPADAQQREQRIERLLRAGSARLAGHPHSLVIDREAQAFVLQQRPAEDLAPVAFDQAVDGFLRALVFWKHVEAQP